MLIYFFKGLKENKIIKAINSFYSSFLWIILVGILTLISEVMGKEILVYLLFVILGVIIPALFAFDMKGMIAPFVFGYITFSRKNNNLSEGLTLTSSPTFKTTIIILVVLILLFSLSKLILDLIYDKERRKNKPTLWLGLLLLGLAYITGGLLTEYYSFKTFAFGLVEILSLAVGYFFFLYAIDYKTLKDDYFAVLFTILGLTLSLQVLFIYLEIGPSEIIGSVEFARGNVFTGWGCYNNIGGEIAFTIAAPAYLVIKKKNSWLYVILGWLILTGLFFAQSRGGILFGTIIYGISVILFLIYSDGKNKTINAVTFLILFVLTALSVIVFWDFFYKIFKNIIDSFDSSSLNQFSSNRLEIYKFGLSQFKDYPIFGVGFYELDGYRFFNVPGNFIPSRYHNTIVQILASTGTLGIIAYIYHRYETIRLTFKRPSIEKTFIFLLILGLLLTSLVDCHFFNLGPGLEYSVLLAILEGKNKTKEI